MFTVLIIIIFIITQKYRMSMDIEKINACKINLMKQCQELREQNCRLQKIITTYQQIMDRERKQKEIYLNKCIDLQLILQNLEDKYDQIIKQSSIAFKQIKKSRDPIAKNSDQNKSNQASTKIFNSQLQQSQLNVNNTNAMDYCINSVKNNLVIKYLYKKKISQPTPPSHAESELIQTKSTSDLNQKKILRTQKQKIDNGNKQAIKSICEQLASKNDVMKNNGGKLKKKLTYFQK